jgi:hypothetical protein
MTDEYYNTSVHAQDLEGGRVLAPGESVKLSEKDAGSGHNAALISEGTLVKKEEKSGRGRTSKGEEE